MTSQLRGWLIRRFSIPFHEPRSPPFVAALRELLNCTLTYTVPKKHVLRVEFWLRRFPWPPGHIPPVQVLRRAFLPILALRPSWVGRRVDVWGTTIHVFCLLPFPSPQPLELSPAWSACLVQQWHSHFPYSSHQKGGLRTPHRKQLPFPAFLSVHLSFFFGSFFVFISLWFWQSELFKTLLFPIFLWMPNSCHHHQYHSSHLLSTFMNLRIASQAPVRKGTISSPVLQMNRLRQSLQRVYIFCSRLHS